MKNNFKQILDEAAKHRKLIPIHYLTSKCSVSELAELETECKCSIDLLETAIVNGVEEALGYTKFTAFFCNFYIFLTFES